MIGDWFALYKYFLFAVSRKQYIYQHCKCFSFGNLINGINYNFEEKCLQYL